MKYVLELVRLCRIQHWIKNVLVLLPLFYGSKFFRTETMLDALFAILSFSFIASAVYVVNDILDIEKDREHSVKRNRPLASGRVSVTMGYALCAMLLLVGFGGSFRAHSHTASFLLLVTYFAINVLYSVRLKNTALVDVFILASGFVFRIFYGGFFFGVPITSWLFLCVFSTALYFAFGKRRCEFARYGTRSQSRPVLAQYSEPFLKAHYYVCCVLSIVFYCLWTITKTGRVDAGKLALTIPFYLFILFRYNMLVESGRSDGDPVPLLLHDKWLLTLSVAFAALNVVIIYFGQYLPIFHY